MSDGYWLDCATRKLVLPNHSRAMGNKTSSYAAMNDASLCDCCFKMTHDVRIHAQDIMFILYDSQRRQ